MKPTLLLLPLVTLLLTAVPTQAKSTVFDLVGHWQATVEFGKFKFRLTVKIDKLPSGKVEAKVDIPEQGAKDIPVSAMLFNYPAVRLEIDPFNTAFNGTVNEAGTEIAGAFDEGPGGRPIALTFKRVDPATTAEPKRTYTFAGGESPDIRGYWEGTVDSPQEGKSRFGLKIGRGDDGSFAAGLDMLDRFAQDLPASTVNWTSPDVKLEWKLFESTFDGVLSGDGQEMTGEWKSRGRKVPVTFQRLKQPATKLPANVSFTPKDNTPEDIRGVWKGALTIPGNKLRLIVRIGQTPDGNYAGTLASIDQGPGEIPISSVGYTNPVVRMEWRGIRGVFTGKLNPEGTVLDGKWEQGGPPLDLQLARAPLTDEPAKP